MNKSPIIFLVILLFAACSTGEKAMKKGNHLEAVEKALSRLQKKSSDDKAQQVLLDAYPLLVRSTLQSVDNLSDTGNPLRWERVEDKYQTLNRVYNKIQLIPVAADLLPEAKSYNRELKQGENKILEARYALGTDLMRKGGRNNAKEAHQHFYYIQRRKENYKDTNRRLDEAAEAAILYVGLYPIPMAQNQYKLSANFFESQLFEFIEQENWNPFVQFVLPSDRNFERLPKDHVIEISFDDFVIGNTYVKETVYQRTAKDAISKEVEVADSTVLAYFDAEAEVRCFSKEIKSSGVIDLKIIGTASNALLTNEKFEGTHIYVTNWGKYNGDEEALTVEDEECMRNSRDPRDPEPQILFTEFTKPIFDQLTRFIKDYYQDY